MSPIIFCNIGWMNYYDGIAGDSISRGGAYNDTGVGHEICNFSEVAGFYYGYVQPTGGKIKLENINGTTDDSSISGITVVWTAGPPDGGTVIVGWYKNATVFRYGQDVENPSQTQKNNGINLYRVKAKVNDSCLLPISQRIFKIPRSVKGGIGQSNVWYAKSEDSKSLIESVKSYINSNTDFPPIDDIDTESSGLEGGKNLVKHLRIERNRKIINKKKKEILAKFGKFSCEVCGFDFSEKYGKYGENFCEVHHKIALSTLDGPIETKTSDLAVVCSNCHRIIHRRNPMFSIEELKSVVDHKI